MGKFDGSLESVVAAADKVLEDNPRASGKMVREALAKLKVDIPTVEGSELVFADDGSVEIEGARYVPVKDVEAAARASEKKLARAEADVLETGKAVADLRQELEAVRAKLVEAQQGPVVSLTGSAMDAGSQALLEAAAKLDERPNLSTTNHRVARWLRSL